MFNYYLAEYFYFGYNSDMDTELDDKYAPGVHVEACSVKGVVQKELCPKGGIRILWEGGQCYSYQREWLDCNVVLINPNTGMRK